MIKEPIYHTDFNYYTNIDTKWEFKITGQWVKNKIIWDNNNKTKYPTVSFSNGESFTGTMNILSFSENDNLENTQSTEDERQLLKTQNPRLISISSFSHHVDNDAFKPINIQFLYGKFTYSDKTVFSGNFKNNIPFGEGQLELSDKSILYGIWGDDAQPVEHLTDDDKKDTCNPEVRFHSIKSSNGDIFKGNIKLVQTDKDSYVDFQGSYRFEINSKPHEKTINKNSILDMITCPITQEVMTIPMFCSVDGNTYDKSAIERWLSNKNTSPFTRDKVTLDNLTVNRNIQLLIDLYQSN